MKKIHYLLTITILTFLVTGCGSDNYLNGEYVSLDKAYVSYNCNKDECIFDMSSPYEDGEFIKQTYVYQLEEKGKNVYKVNFTNKENGQEHTATWNKEEDNLYIEDLKVNCRKTINTNIEVNTKGFKIKLTKVYVSKSLSHNINEYDDNFLLASTSSTNLIEALDNYKLLGFEFEYKFIGTDDYPINLYELLSIYNKEYKKYNIKELWYITGREPAFVENDIVYYDAKMKEMPGAFVIRGYLTIPKEEDIIYIKVNDNSKETYSISLK